MKLKVQKFQIGGEFASLAVNYHPLSASTTAGAYAPAVASSEGKSSSKSSEKDELSIKDVLKVFDNVKGLPIDVLYVLSDFRKMFLTDTLTSFSGKPSISSLVSYYLNNIGKFNMLAQSKENYDKAREDLIRTNSLDEIAIDRHGKIVVKNENGELDAISFNDYKNNMDSYLTLTNRELLNLRQTELPFGDSIYGNMTGASMDTVIKKVNSIVQSLGHSEKKIEGYTAKQANDIKSGLAVLLDATTSALEAGSMTVNGLYKNAIISKDLKAQAETALKAVYASLNPLEKTLVALHSSSTNPIDLLSNIILSRTSDTYHFEPTLLPNLNLDGSVKKTEKEKLEALENVNPLLLMLRMQGGELKSLLIQTDGVETISIPAKYYSAIPKADSSPMSVEKMLSDSGLSAMLQGEGITFGDQPISRANLSSVMYDNSGGYMALLPCITDMNGNKYVDLSVLDEYKKVARNIDEEPGTPAYYLALALGLKEAGIDELLTGSNTLNLDRFLLFFVFTGYTVDNVLKNNPKFKDSKYIKEVSDSSIGETMKKALSTKENGEFDIDPYDKWGIFEIWNGWDDIYKATVYVPITANLNSPYMAYGLSIKLDIADKHETDYLRFNSKLKSFNPNNSFIQ